MAYTFQFEVFSFSTGLPVLDPVFNAGDIILNPNTDPITINEVPEPLHASGTLQTLTIERNLVEGDKISIMSVENLWSGGVEIVSSDPVFPAVENILTIVREIPGKNTGEYDRRHTDGRIVREQILPVNGELPTE